MNDGDRFDEFVAEAAKDHYHPPGDTPREEIWARLRQARDARTVRAGEPDLGGPARRVPPWARWGIGIAAALLVGIGVGRVSVMLETEVTPERPAADRVAAVIPGDDPSPGGARAASSHGAVPTPFRLAAMQTMGRAEIVLTSFRSEASAGRITGETTAWARELLTTTRLLIDSPASRDPRMRSLLRDLELVLAQIANLRPEAEAHEPELELVADAVDRRDVLSKVRMMSAGGPAMGPDR